MSSLISRKIVLIGLEFIILIGMLLFQYLKFLEMSNNVLDQYLINALLLSILGNVLDLLMALSVVFLIVNILLYKYCLKTKRWLLKPFFIFVITLVLAITGSVVITNHWNNEIELTSAK